MLINKSNFRAWNEEMGKKYNPDDFHNRSNFIIRHIERLRVNKIIEKLAPREDDNILEVGCGAGNIMEKIPFGAVTGIDLSDYLIKIAKNKLKSNNKIFISNASCLPFRHNSFNKIICSEVLEHVLEPNLVLNEILRVLTPGGTLIITIPNEELINRLKKIIVRLRLLKLFNPQSGYNIAENMADQWHIRSFQIKEFINRLANDYKIDGVYPSPNKLLALRHIIKCSKDKNG